MNHIIAGVDYPHSNIEIILGIGEFPSIQRNRAAQIASGDIVYFLNSDVKVLPDIFKKAVALLDADKSLAGVGGPDLTPPDNSFLQHLFGYAMGSFFAHWKMRARYSVVGKERLSDERELLLSNMAIRKDVFLRLNGFNQNLYPNEENEFLNRLADMGYKVMYSPDLRVYRDRRKTISAFMRQFYRYGKGRMNQIRLEGIGRNWLFLAPPLVFIYLLSLPFAGSFFWFVPLSIYFFLGVTDAIWLSWRNRKNLVLQLPFIYLVMHLSYATGFLARLIAHCCNLTPELSKECQVRILKKMGEGIELEEYPASEDAGSDRYRRLTQ
ncbi:MAG: glycosyltransferase [Candidatus Omnitrophica bacterium]|nr:glycosyltransferase [Candidatus Omnitrophota bacterium]